MAASVPLPSQLGSGHGSSDEGDSWQVLQNIPEITAIYDRMMGFDVTLRDLLGDHARLMLYRYTLPNAPGPKQQMMDALEHMDQESKRPRPTDPDWEAKRMQFKLWIDEIQGADQLQVMYHMIMGTLLKEQEIFQETQVAQSDMLHNFSSTKPATPAIPSSALAKPPSPASLSPFLPLSSSMDDGMRKLARTQAAKPAAATASPLPLIPLLPPLQAPPPRRTNSTPPLLPRAIDRLVGLNRSPPLPLVPPRGRSPMDERAPWMDHRRSSAPVFNSWEPVFDNNAGSWPP